MKKRSETRAPGSSGRALKVRVKTGRGRTVGQVKWLERQLNDPYVAAAKAAGYRSRAAYKLVELDQRNRLLPRHGHVVDLGAAPGGWTQVAVARTGSGGRVIGLDIDAIEPIAGADLIQLDFLDSAAPARLVAALGGPADTVLSDMAAPATGHRQTDHVRIMALCEAALGFAEQVLKPGGAFVCKVQRGGTEGALLSRMKAIFRDVKHEKPPASRADSAEMYVVARGFKGAAHD